VIIAADAADAAGDEVGITGIFVSHKDAITPEDRGSRVAFNHLSIVKIDLGIDTQTTDHPCDRIPRHLDQFAGSGFLRRT
jgi:hypothetical protein